MKVEVKQIEELVRELEIEVPAETVTEAMNRKFQEVRREAHFKGYRKGKAPMEMIRSAYTDQVKADVAEDIIKTTYTSAIQEQKLRVASHPEVTAFNIEDDGSIKYTAKVEVFPEITTVVNDGLEVTETKVEVADSDVDEVIENVRKNQSELRPVERAATDTDILTLDLEKLLDPGMVLKQDKFEDSEIDLGNKLTIKEFREHLIGTKVGDVKEVEVNYDKEYPDPTFAGATLKYKCTVKKVQERILPPADDTLAKSTGQAETMLELRLKVRERLQAQKADELKRDRKTQIITQMCKKNEIPIPKALVADYVENVMKDFKSQGGEYDEAEVRKAYEEIGTSNIRWNMLLHRLADQEKIEVLPSDTEELIGKFAENYNMTPDEAKEALHKSNRISDIRESILEDKVIDFLADKAKVVSAPK